MSDKPIVELVVNGSFVGYIKDIEYRRDATLVDEGNCREYAAGNTVVCDVTLVSHTSSQCKYRLLDAGEQLQLTDEWFSVVEMNWYPISMFRQDLDGQYSDGDLYRRKALVLV